MARIGFIIFFILGMGIIFPACTTLEYLDGSSKKEITEFKKDKGKSRDNKEKLKVENVSLRGEIDVLRKENQKIRDEAAYKMETIRDQNKRLSQERGDLKEINQRISKENKVLTQKLNTFQQKQAANSSGLEKVVHDKEKIRIKVLRGDGDLNSAKKMSKKLKSVGYKIKLIDSAPRSNFKGHTVYFAPPFQTEAKQLASSIGNGIIMKPLLWSSVFNIIVVTGKNP